VFSDPVAASGLAGGPRSRSDEVRWLAPVFAVAVAIVAAVIDHWTVSQLLLSAVPVLAFAVWAYVPDTPLVAVALAVLLPTVLVQRSGSHEVLIFEASVLAFVVGCWSSSLAEAVALGVLAVASPVVVSVIETGENIAVGIWVLGIGFPWGIGLAISRQGKLAAQLEATRRELAEQALLEERRRIARDVHDFVGHGLAAVMLQVTSARHVLHRDPQAAEEALLSAEAVGRRSMQELRRTVALLRSDDQEGVAAPVPTASEIPALVDHVRAGGVAVELRMRGDLADIPAGVGLALYRIAQEALANAARHAPRARTTLVLELSDTHASLTADTVGPLPPAAESESRRPGYGLIGMRERAAALGGEVSAGPVAGGWRVECRVPLHPAEETTGDRPPARRSEATGSS